MLKGILSTKENAVGFMMVLYFIMFSGILHHAITKGSVGSLEKVALVLGFALIVFAWFILRNEKCDSCECEPCQPCPTVRTAPLATEKTGSTTRLAPLYDRATSTKESTSTNTKMLAL